MQAAIDDILAMDTCSIFTRSSDVFRYSTSNEGVVTFVFYPPPRGIEAGSHERPWMAVFFQAMPVLRYQFS